MPLWAFMSHLTEIFETPLRARAAASDREVDMSARSQDMTAWRLFDRMRRGIGPRLLMRVLLFSVASTLVLTLSQLYLDYRRDTGAIDHRMAEIADSYGHSLGEGLWSLDRRQLELQIEGSCACRQCASSRCARPPTALIR